MKKFIYKTILISLPIILLLLSILLCYGVPPPKLSTSLSFNAKVLNIKEKQLDDNLDILAVGSSMSLNNIHTETVKNHFGPKYMNFSSWGQNIAENYNLIKTFTKHYKPRTIIISSGYMDFNNSYKDIKYKLVDDYLSGAEMLIYKELNLKYLLKESISFFNKKNDVRNYTSLMYDDCGGVNFKKNNFNIKNNRWNGNITKDFKLDILQYNYLDSISQFCKIKDINLVFIQSPYREGYYSQLDKTSKDILFAHKSKIYSILEKNNQLFINTENELWEDNLYVDYSHFNSEGAKKYTEYFIAKIMSYELKKKGLTLY